MQDEFSITYPEMLPITQHRREIVDAVKTNRVLIVAGETGSGKTTQLPKMCLEAGRGRKGVIGCTQPRRIAASSVAARVAEELGPLQEGMVGYKVRFQDKTGRRTRIKFMTDGILLAEAQIDRKLSAYDTIIIDEAHERSLNIDFLLGMLNRLLKKRRDLRLIITSATIDTEKFSKAFDGAPVIEVSGRSYPVEIVYRPVESVEEEGETAYIEEAVEAAMDIVRRKSPGDILVFMPTERDILEITDGLSAKLKSKEMRQQQEIAVLPLFGRMAAKDQKKIFSQVRGRKIVIATNVAETSITVPGIRFVIDTGLARISHYNVRARTTKMPVAKISRASCDQRTGRCGRVGPGVCIRLFDEADYNGRDRYTAPEILRSNLAEVVLRMLSLKLGEPQSFPFIDKPSRRNIADGFKLLHELGAIKSGDGRGKSWQLTATGRLMARLPLDPTISRMIVEARDNNCLQEAAIIAAALSVQDPRVRPVDSEKEADRVHSKFQHQDSDFLSYLAIWNDYEKVWTEKKGRAAARRYCRKNFLAYQRMREWRDIYEQICSILAAEKGFMLNVEPASSDSIHQALLSGSLRTIAVKKSGRIYNGAHNKEVMIFPGSGLFEKSGPWIMAAEQVETTRLYARTVANIKPEWIEPLARHICSYSYSEPHWEKGRGQVVAYEKVTLFGLIIVARRKSNFGRIDRREARQIFIQEALVAGNLKGSYRFLEHNLALIADLQNAEDRMRRRDILVDEMQLFDFYDRRLTEDVHDQRGLNLFLKKHGNKQLLMTQEDILNVKPPEQELQDFPEKLIVDDIPLTLSYSFEPGSDEDGVSVLIPVALLGNIAPRQFDWLVPGMLYEKVLFLLKGLPKSIRRHLIPIPGTAETICRELEFGAGSFYSALEQFLKTKYQLKVGRKNWPIDSLPPYLRFRFCLVTDGKIIKCSRNFNDLLPDSCSAAAQDQLAELRHEYERDGIVNWDFEGLPGQITVTDSRGVLCGYAYPFLEAQGDGTVSIRLTLDRKRKTVGNAEGMLVLYKNMLKTQWKQVRKDISFPRSKWALYEGYGTYDEFNRRLQIFILEQVFKVHPGRIPAEDEFQATIRQIREKGLAVLCREVLRLVIEMLQKRREVLDLILSYRNKMGNSPPVKKRYADMRHQVDSLVPVNFTEIFDMKRLMATPRYLQALHVRLERQVLSPAKDEAKAAQVAVHETRLKACAEQAADDDEVQELLAEYREMIEEFKVSLFAQEIKTAMPVSAKRLEKKWRELEGFCHVGGK